MPYVLLRAFVLLLPTWLHFLRALRALIFLRALRILVLYVPYVPSFFLRGYILFMYMLKKRIQVNELTYDIQFLLLLKSVIYQRLSSISVSYSTVSFLR